MERRPHKYSKRAVLVARPGSPPFDVPQPAIRCVSHTPGCAGQEVSGLFERGAVAGNPQRLHNIGTVSNISARRRPLDTEQPTGHELIVASDLPTEHIPGRAKANEATPQTDEMYNGSRDRDRLKGLSGSG